MDKQTALTTLAEAGYSEQEIDGYIELAEGRQGTGYWAGLPNEATLLSDMQCFIKALELPPVNSKEGQRLYTNDPKVGG